MENSKIYYSDFKQHDEPKFSGQLVITNECEDIHQSSQKNKTDKPEEGFGFKETKELRDSRRLWMVVSGVLVAISVLFLSLTLYFAFSGQHNVQKTSSKDPCESRPCINGGTCFKTGCSYHCSCLDGYSGHQCQTTPCSVSPCMNGGRCQIQNSSYNCQCAEGYRGKECQVTPCSGNPCLYNGTCDIVGSSYRCFCMSGYNGTRCEYTPCDSVTCLNHGSCTPVGETYECSCTAGFSGRKCERTPCSDLPCKNGGRCVVSEGKFRCSCKSGFHGARCESYRSCPSGWSQHDGKCYFFSGFKREWSSAKEYCASEKSILAEPKTRETINYVKSVAKSRGQTYWIGGTDKQQESLWIWASSKTRVTVTDWHTRTVVEPNNQNGREHCMNIHRNLDYEWNDDYCLNRYRFICEKH